MHLAASDNERDRFQEVRLFFNPANQCGVLVTQSLQLGEARLCRLRRDAGQQPTSGLRVEEQRVSRCARRGFKVANGAAQAYVLRLQGTENTRCHRLFGAVEDGQAAQVKRCRDLRSAGHFHQMAEEAKARHVGTGRDTELAAGMPLRRD